MLEENQEDFKTKSEILLTKREQSNNKKPKRI